MSPENMKLVNVRVKPSLWAQVQAVAKAQDIRLSEAVREALTAYVRRHRKLLEEPPAAED
jgi:predicted HicB family RNase H-like nuclease